MYYGWGVFYHSFVIKYAPGINSKNNRKYAPGKIRPRPIFRKTNLGRILPLGRWGVILIDPEREANLISMQNFLSIQRYRDSMTKFRENEVNRIKYRRMINNLKIKVIEFIQL